MSSARPVLVALWFGLITFVVVAPVARAADPVPLYKAGIAAKKTGDLAGAEKSFRACIAADAKYGRCHFSLGVLLRKREALAEAEGHFEKALAAHPSWGQAHFSLGLTRLARGDAERAKASFEAALADKDLEPEDRAESWNALGVMHRQAGRLKEAIAAYEQALAAAPRAMFHLNKAMALERLADYPAAEAAARAATTLAPDDPVAWTLVARAVSLQKRVADAVPAWRRVTELAPREAEGWYGLGESAEAAGQKELARSAFEAYLALAPAGADPAPIRTRIERNR